jgi:hypothetical protein
MPNRTARAAGATAEIIYSSGVTRLAVFLAAALLTVSCAPSNPLTVTDVQLGRSINSDDSVGAFTNRFRPEETVYVAALTGGPGTSTITARWTYNGRTVSEQSKEVSYREPAATEFHIQYAGGFPLGSYRVEILVDGMTAATRDFFIAE